MCFVFLYTPRAQHGAQHTVGLNKCLLNEWAWRALQYFEMPFSPWDVWIWEVTWVTAVCLAGSVHFILLLVSSCQDPCSVATSRNEQSASSNRCLMQPNGEPATVLRGVFSLSWRADTWFQHISARFASQENSLRYVPPYSSSSVTHSCLKDNKHFLRLAFQSLPGLPSTPCAVYPMRRVYRTWRLSHTDQSLSSAGPLTSDPWTQSWSPVSWFISLRVCILSSSIKVYKAPPPFSSCCFPRLEKPSLVLLQCPVRCLLPLPGLLSKSTKSRSTFSFPEFLHHLLLIARLRHRVSNCRALLNFLLLHFSRAISFSRHGSCNPHTA